MEHLDQPKPAMEQTPAAPLLTDPGKRQPLANDVGVDSVGNGNAGNGRTGLQAFLNNLGFERFEVRASLAHGNPDVKGYRIRLKIRGHHRP